MIPQDLQALQWRDGKLILLDQRKLPRKIEFYSCVKMEDCIYAIKSMIVRGAPLIGFTAIFGLALWLKEYPSANLDELKNAGQKLVDARPTAVNLYYEVERTLAFIQTDPSCANLWEKVVSFAFTQIELLKNNNTKMAFAAEKKLEEFGSGPYRLMTLCNTGYLACGTLGTALGVITHLAKKNKIAHVYASETRPYLQGARLTAFELKVLNIPHSVVVDGAASYLMREKLVDAIFIGADRIVANGDTANKIGSAGLAAIAKHYGIPFYVVAPLSSFDFNLTSGEQIPVELRSPQEILSWNGHQISADGVNALNPSFDITEAALISGIFCEAGFFSPVTTQSLNRIKQGA